MCKFSHLYLVTKFIYNVYCWGTVESLPGFEIVIIYAFKINKGKDMDEDSLE